MIQTITAYKVDTKLFETKEAAQQHLLLADLQKASWKWFDIPRDVSPYQISHLIEKHKDEILRILLEAKAEM